MAVKIKNTATAGKGGVKVTDKKTGTEKLEEVETPVDIIQNVANVGVSASYTKNLGNYESAKIEVWLNVPCEAGSEEEAFTYVKNWVDAKLQSEVAEMEG